MRLGLIDYCSVYMQVWRHRTSMGFSMGQGQEEETCRSTLALAFLQFVQAFGVTESGTFRRLPVPLLEVPGRGRPDVIDELGGESVGDDCWASWMDCADESSEILL